MQSWEKEQIERRDRIEFDLEKSFYPDLQTEKEFNDFIKLGGYTIVEGNSIEKAQKDVTKLIKKEVWVNRGGKSFRQTVYVSPEDNKETETPIGGELSPTVKGLQIEKYSEKAILIKGDTYTNVNLMRQIKVETGFGIFNKALGGWVYSLNQLDKVLGLIWSDVKDKDEDKAQAIQNQKNASLTEGDEVFVGGDTWRVVGNSSDSEGIKYNVTLPDGTKLEGVDEKVMEVAPEMDDKKIAEIVNNAQPENRAKTEKMLYGIKPISNIHSYSLEDYMKLHGLSEEDIQQAIKRIQPKEKKEGEKKRTTSGGSGTKSEKGQTESLTKNQLIGKLIITHYQAVQKAIEGGEEVPESALAYYPELAEKYSKQRQAMSEETKRKISEALKKNKPEEVEQQDMEKLNKPDSDKDSYEPKNGETIKVEPLKGEYNGVSVDLKTKDYTDYLSLNVSIPKANKILTTPKPSFIPKIDEEMFKRQSYSLNAVKLGEDRYLVALDGFETKGYSPMTLTTKSINSIGRFAIMSLDVFTATKNYYAIRAKEEYKQIETEKAKAKRERTLNNLKEALENYKAKGEAEWVKTIQRRIEQEESARLSVGRLSILPETKMTYSQMHMFQMLHRGENGEPLSQKEAWSKYYELQGDVKQKSLDLELQQEEIESSYTKGVETSYGDSGTKDDLLSEYGVKVKRQNGDEINKSEIDQIKGALDSTAKVFGHNPNMNKEFGLKISHSGNVLMHARKASGLFISSKRAIGVTAQGGDNQFRFTFGHEYAHFMDYWVGKNTGNHFASDKQGSTANSIATVFGKYMNKPEGVKEVGGYWGRSCEKFARALEQYHAIEVYGEDVVKWESEGAYFTKPYYAPKEVYESKIKPLIKQFLEENKEILKSTLFDFFG
jgi:hypothetical protein